MDKIILTEKEKNNIRSKLESLKLEVYKTDFSLEKNISEGLSETEKDIVKSAIGETSEANKLEEKANEFLESLSKLEKAYVKLPFVPSANFISWIKQVFKENSESGTGVLIKFEHHPEIFAGAKIDFKGKIFDETVRSKVVEILSDV